MSTTLVTDEVMRGLIPWSYDGLAEAWRFLRRRGALEEYENALVSFLRQRYSPERAAAHFWRFEEIRSFLARWDHRLRAEGLTDGAKVSGLLLRALAEAPFTATRRYGRDRCPTFDLGAVLVRVVAFS